MSHKVTLIPGDGIGPEVTQAPVRILEAPGVKFEWETFAVGAERCGIRRLDWPRKSPPLTPIFARSCG